MLTTAYEVLQNAYKGHHTVPTINTQGGIYGIMRVVCIAAEEFRSPVISIHYVNTGAYSDHDQFYETVKRMAARVSVPVVIHLNHGGSFERCMKMSKLGFTSIMFDGSALPVEENATTTKAVARICRSFGMSLEAKIGELCRLDDRGNKMGVSSITDPDAVRQYLEFCHPGLLATGTGNTHGFYNGPVDIRAEALEECRKLTDIPFALHGYTDMDKELAKCFINSGMIKINSSTQVCCQYMNYLKEGLAEGKDQGHTWRPSQYAGLRLCEGVKDIIRLVDSQEKA